MIHYRGMSDIVQADIFFFIASVGIIILTTIVCLILYQVLRVVKSIRRLVERVEEGSEIIAEDVAQLRTFVMEGSLVSQLISFFVPKAPRRKRRSSHADDVD